MLSDSIEERLNKFIIEILNCKNKEQITNKCDDLSNFFVTISIIKIEHFDLTKSSFYYSIKMNRNRNH